MKFSNSKQLYEYVKNKKISLFDKFIFTIDNIKYSSLYQYETIG